MSNAAANLATAPAWTGRRHPSARPDETRTHAPGHNRVGTSGDDLDQLVCDLRLSLAEISQMVLQPGAATAIGACENHALYCVLAGEGVSTVGGRSIALRRGSAILMTRSHEMTFQAVSTRSPLTIVRIIMNAQLARRPQFLDWLAEPLYDHDDTALKIEALNAIQKLAEQPRVGGMAIAEALLKAVFVGMLIRIADRETLDERFMASITHPGVARVVNHVAEHPDRHHTVDGMAMLAGVTHADLSLQFRHIFGLSPAEYVRQVRLLCAETLLNDTDLPVKTIAGMVGFGSRSHFSRIFFDHSGLDPTAFRRRTESGPTCAGEISA